MDLRYQKDICLKEIGLHAQNLLTIVVLIVNIIGKDLYDRLMRKRIATLIVKKLSI
jgi:hypothetical protein